MKIWKPGLRHLPLALALAGALLAMPALAADPTEAETAALVSAIEKAGCRVDGSNADAVLAASGLSEDKAGEVVERLKAEGKAEQAPEDMALILKTGRCR